MLYVSSSCMESDNIKNIIQQYVKVGIKNIELSGGTKYYPEIIDDLFELKDKYQLNFLIHNYFPPPKYDFVLNLASLNEEIISKSIAHYRKSLELAISFQSPCYALHAGFFFDPHVDELGKKANVRRLNNKDESINAFVESYSLLKHEFGQKIELYIENNVVSCENMEVFGENPFMLTSYSDYIDLKKEIDFNFLLDFGHLQVSAATLSLDFKEELLKLFSLSNYIHLSDNDGKSDQHKILNPNGLIQKNLKNLDIRDKIVSLEMCDTLTNIKLFYDELYNEKFKLSYY